MNPNGIGGDTAVIPPPRSGTMSRENRPGIVAFVLALIPYVGIGMAPLCPLFGFT